MHGFTSYNKRGITGKIGSSNIIEHFRNIEDPRIERNKKHLVWDIISLTICAVVCGCETWEEIELYGKEKHDWLSTILELPIGIPSHDTIRRLFIRLNPEQLLWFFGDIDLETDKTEGLIDTHHDVDKDHGRIEIRECICSEEIDWLKPSLKGWTDVRTIAMVKATRIIGEKES